MGILTLLLIIIVVLVLINFRKINKDLELSNQLKMIRRVGILALIIGVFGQLIGLYAGFATIESAGDISSGVLAGGIRVSMITTLYGIVIYIISFLCYMFLDWLRNRKN